MLAAVSLVLVTTLVLGSHYDTIKGVSLISDSYPTSQDSVDFGTGYSTLTFARTYNSAVDVRTRQAGGGGAGSYLTFTYNIDLIKTRDELESAFSAGASVSASYMGAVTGSASVQFLTETAFTSLNTVLVARVDAITSTKTVQGTAAFKPAPRQLLKNRQFREFVDTYGTHYLHQYTMGGKMLLVMKFSSRSQEEKRELETELELNTGVVGTGTNFGKKLRTLKSQENMKVQVFATGGTTTPPQGDIAACIQYSIDYSASIRSHPTVREVGYLAYWTVPGAPAGLTDYLFPLQDRADTTVGLSAELLDVHNDAEDMLSLRNSDLAFIRSPAWTQIKAIKKTTEKKRKDLQTKYQIATKSPTLKKLDAIIKEFSGIAKPLDVTLSKIIGAERVLEAGGDGMGDRVTLQTGGGLYISTAVNKRNRLDTRGPVPFALRDVSLENHVTVGDDHYVYIRSVRNQMHSLRMDRLGHKISLYSNRDCGPRTNDQRCQWRIVHVNADESKSVLEYGDRIIIYNRKYPGWVMGIDEDSKWLRRQKYSQASSQDNQWIVGRPERQEEELE